MYQLHVVGVCCIVIIGGCLCGAVQGRARLAQVVGLDSRVHLAAIGRGRHLSLVTSFFRTPGRIALPPSNTTNPPTQLIPTSTLSLILLSRPGALPREDGFPQVGVAVRRLRRVLRHLRHCQQTGSTSILLPSSRDSYPV